MLFGFGLPVATQRALKEVKGNEFETENKHALNLCDITTRL